MILLIILFIISFAASWVSIRVGIDLSHNFGIVDQPGGHKQHDRGTPFVGGAGIFAVLIAGMSVVDAWYPYSEIHCAALGTAASIIFFSGLADDIWLLNYKVRILIQTVGATLMALWGEVMLLDLGNLVSSQPLALGMAALPFTVFATIGVINALNMIDGIDGLSGSLSLASLSLLAIVALVAGREAHLALVIILLGGVAGFLYFNLRRGSRRRAEVFLGDNGSMLLGLLLCWLLIGLSQGESRAMSPVTALWIFAIPLVDAVGAIVRRVSYRHSPFHPDRDHLHHLLMRAGFRVQDIVHIAFAMQLTIGGVGLMGLYAGVDESWMLAGFLGMFLCYYYLIARPWRCVPILRRLHNRLGLTSVYCRGVFVGQHGTEDEERFFQVLLEELGPRDNYDLCVYRSKHGEPIGHFRHAIIELYSEEHADSVKELQKLVGRLKQKFDYDPAISVRQLIERNDALDPRIERRTMIGGSRITDRRSKENKTLIYQMSGRAKAEVGAMALSLD
ncbi:MAG TPA: MraY family glycosyltransferase [Candidatus Competibacter sp.]|nr:MraY family glycosyltransferase [Candidatus Competibacter sp.]HUM95238.1 MraY family glycosyltransferase [Candidatus Competibacter sp.]